MMTVLYGIGMILRFILKIALLPVQAALTLLMLAIGFIGGFANIACGLIGSFFVIGGICSFINGDISLGWQVVCGAFFVVRNRKACAGVSIKTVKEKEKNEYGFSYMEKVLSYC